MFIHSSPVDSTTTEVKRTRQKDAQKKDVQLENADRARQQEKLHEALTKAATVATTSLHDPQMSPAQNYTQIHAELTASYATHYANYKPENHPEGPVKDFIESTKTLHAEALDTMAMLAVDPSDSGAFASLSDVLPKSLESTTGKALSVMSTATEADEQATRDANVIRFTNLLSSLVNEGEYDPAHSIDIDMMHAVFSAIDIGSGVAKASGQVTDVYTKISTMINDLLAIANYFNVIFNEAKAELQKYTNNDHPAPSNISWDMQNVQSGDHTWANIGTLLQTPGGTSDRSVNTDFYNNALHYVTGTATPPGDIGIFASSLAQPPVPGTKLKDLYYKYGGGGGFISPKVVEEMVATVARAMKGISVDEVGQGYGQFYESWKDMVSSDGKVSGALQGLSSAVSSLSQKAGQNTNTVSIILNSIMSLFQKLMDLISASGSARDRISSS